MVNELKEYAFWIIVIIPMALLIAFLIGCVIENVLVIKISIILSAIDLLFCFCIYFMYRSKG